MLIEAYGSLVAGGELQMDEAQRRAVLRLAALADRLGSNDGGGLIARLFGARQAAPPKGIYIYGPVGRGKTMLMDLFFASVAGRCQNGACIFTPSCRTCTRELHAARKREQDAIAPVAARPCRARRELLCLDEMQYRDIADAMIVGRLFEALLAPWHGDGHDIQPAAR